MFTSDMMMAFSPSNGIFAFQFSSVQVSPLTNRVVGGGWGGGDMMDDSAEI